jgi:DNA-binding NarL/FixJ family response regulator
LITHANLELIRVVLADDHKLVRAGFRLMLNSLGAVEVVGETGNGLEALELIRTQAPQLALLDITMPGLTGIEVAVRIQRERLPTKVIILSMHVDEEYVIRAVQAGIAGYLLKTADPMELELAVSAALAGETYLSPGISKHIISDYVRRVRPGESPLDQLTARQREILQLIAEGKNTKTIAEILKISVKTVETHRASLMDRLGVRDVAGLVRFAIRHGVIEPE